MEYRENDECGDSKNGLLIHSLLSPHLFLSYHFDSGRGLNIYLYNNEHQPNTLELSHLNGIDSTLVAFVAQSATTTVLGLLQVVGCQQSKDYRDIL